MTPRRHLITGGSGFIGSHLAAALTRAGDKVHLLVRPGGPARLTELALPGLEVHRVQLGDQKAVSACLDQVRPDVIHHLASGTGRGPLVPAPGEIPLLLRDLTNFLTLLAAAAECRTPPECLIRAGSLAEYGNRSGRADEDQRERPAALYTAAMVAGTHYAAMLQSRLPFPVLTARFALTYGAGQDESFFLPWLIARCLRGERSRVRNPEARRDMIYVDDLVEGLRRMAEAELPAGTILNLCTGSTVSVRELALLAVRTCGANPDLLQFAGREEFETPVRHLEGSPERAQALLGWRARTNLAEGLKRTVGNRVAQEAQA